MKQSISIAIILLVFTTGAMTQQKFDIVWYSAPAGWEIQSTSSQLTIFKKSTSSAPAQILIFPSVPTGVNANEDFNAQWKKNVKGRYPGIMDSFTRDIQNDGEWTYYSSYSYTTINKMEVVIAFTLLRSKSSMVSMVNIIPDESNLADINTFLGGLEIEEGTASGATHTKIFRRKRVMMKSKKPKFRAGKGLRDHI